MSPEVGLKSQYLNWRAGLTPELGIVPEWIVIDWWKTGGFVERLYCIPSGLKARIRSRIQLREGLAKGPFDALFIAGHTIYLSNELLDKQPYFLTADVTARQLHAFGDLYNKLPSRISLLERQKHRFRCSEYRNAAALFPWSKWAAAGMIEDYGADPKTTHIIPPGVDLDRWKCAERSADCETTNILFVGGDFIRKGGDLLLKWASLTSSSNWSLHLVTRDRIDAPSANVHIYNGLQPNDPALTDLYRKAHLFALPTRGDCYSIAGIEAMAAGLPVILSCTGGTGDIIRDGETGYLIKPNDFGELAERLDYLVANPKLRMKMGLRARTEAEERYDARKNVAKTVKIMRQSMGA